MKEQPHFFKTLDKKQGAYLSDAPGAHSQINLGKVNLLSRIKFNQIILESIPPIFEVNVDLNIFLCD